MRRMWAVAAATVTCLALGGMAALAQEASPGAASITPAMPDGPALVTGTQTCTPGDPDTRTWDGPVLTGRNATVACTDEMSDPRVSGPDTSDWNYVCHSDADMGCIYWGTTEIVGPDGTWIGTYTGTDDAALWDAGEGGAVMIQVLEGTGAYEDWTYIAHVVTDLSNPAMVNGLIYEGPPPPWGPIPAAVTE